jgi:hypothetical protein
MIKRPKRFHKPSARVRDGGSNLAALAALPSLGRTSAQMLIEVGIPDKAMLREIGTAGVLPGAALPFRAARLDEFHLCA